MGGEEERMFPSSSARRKKLWASRDEAASFPVKTFTR